MKNKNSIRGMHDVRTMGSLQKGGPSEKQNSVYIDLYMLSKEEKRILDEKKRIELRLEAINNRLKDIEDFRSQVMKVEGHDDQGRKIAKEDEQAPVPKWKTMPLNY